MGEDGNREGRAEFRAALVTRLVGAAQVGALPRRLVADAAEACGVSERTVWRWVKAGHRAEPVAHGWQITTRAHALYVQWRGNVAAVHRELVAEGASPPSMRTMQRAFARDMTPAEQAYVRRGDAGRQEHAVHLRHEARYRAECYEGDHKQLSVEVLALRGSRPQRPWATLFVDQFSRLIVGWSLSLRPTQSEVLAALRMAVMVDSERGPYGGIPTRLRWDNGLEFAATSIEDAALGLGCIAQATTPYSPWEKGKIERLNRTLEQELLQGLPRWTGGPRDRTGRLQGAGPMTLELFVAKFADWVEQYNTRRAHSALGGQTPLARWQADATPVRALSAEEARWLLRARAEKVLNKDGIHHNSDVYFAPELNGLGGETLQIAYMPHDRRSIEIYRDGRWLATALRQTDLTEAEREQALKQRQADHRALAKRTAKARRLAQVRLAPITSTTVEEIDLPSAPVARSTASRRASLRLLGVQDDVNQPRPESGQAGRRAT